MAINVVIHHKQIITCFTPYPPLSVDAGTLIQLYATSLIKPAGKDRNFDTVIQK
jgi:hypothetical protein